MRGTPDSELENSIDCVTVTKTSDGESDLCVIVSVLNRCRDGDAVDKSDSVTVKTATDSEPERAAVLVVVSAPDDKESDFSVFVSVFAR